MADEAAVDAELARGEDARDAGASDEEDEYGLRELARLPLLEQVHRLFHAIQHKYPYKDTHAWKTLPVDQKKRMLDYIRDRRARNLPVVSETVEKDVVAPEQAPVERSSADHKDAPAAAPKADPYLQMLQRRTLRSAPANAATGAHPNSAYVAPAAVAEYAESVREAKKRLKARWKLAESEFYETQCVCGVTHSELSRAKGTIQSTISAMMSTFGDADRSCVAAVEEVQHLVGEFVRRRLQAIDPEELAAGLSLRRLVEIFESEAIYYGRWREFRGETKHEQNELEDVEEEELAEELDLFAVSESNAVFNEEFMERIRFADERTKSMDWTIYDVFAKGRKTNFMSNKGKLFQQWIGIEKSSRASLEFLNFVAYHNIGRLVELAIKHRTGGQLKALETALLKDDVQAVSHAFLPPERLPSLIDGEVPPTKARRVGLAVTPHNSKRQTSRPTVQSSQPGSESQCDSITTSAGEKTKSEPGASMAITPSGISTRLTRLKRLR